MDDLSLFVYRLKFTIQILDISQKHFLFIHSLFIVLIAVYTSQINSIDWRWTNPEARLAGPHFIKYL